MSRAVAVVGVLAFAAAAALLAIDVGEYLLRAVLLLLLAAAAGIFLAIRRGFQIARGVARDARAFVSGDAQHARLLEVGDPRGIVFTRSNVVVELEGEDGARHRFDRDVPVPFFVAWGYRIAKRLHLPLIGRRDLGEMLAFELRREGFRVGAGRPSEARALDP